MADFLVKQGREIGGVSLVTDAGVSHKVDLTSIIETGTTASQAISAGTYFYLNDTLVRAKTAIANGATFTLNTNYEVVTAGGLNELRDGLYYKPGDYIDLTVQDYLYGLYYTNYLNLHLPLFKPIAPNVVGATLTNLPSSFGVGTVYGLRSAANASVSSIRIASTCIEITIYTDVMSITEYSPLVVGITGRLTFN